jgi:hypothetical protein
LDVQDVEVLDLALVDELLERVQRQGLVLADIAAERHEGYIVIAEDDRGREGGVRTTSRYLSPLSCAFT